MSDASRAKDEQRWTRDVDPAHRNPEKKERMLMRGHAKGRAWLHGGQEGPSLLMDADAHLAVEGHEMDQEMSKLLKVSSRLVYLRLDEMATWGNPSKNIVLLKKGVSGWRAWLQCRWRTRTE